MTRKLRVRIVLGEDPDSFPSTHIRQFIISYNFSSWGFKALVWTRHKCAQIRIQIYQMYATKNKN